jgi:hypothetical protein
VWIHYVAAKIGRGEIFEALNGLSLLRGYVLGPLIAIEADVQPSGVRRLERVAPARTAWLRDTIATREPRDCVRALRACVEMYRALRPSVEFRLGG